MTALEKLKDWLATYPGHDILGTMHVDYTDQIPSNGGIFPNGLVEVARSQDIVGNVTVTNQLNFGLYVVFSKAPGDDVGALINADWIADFQEWVQEQSITGGVPAFGSDPNLERITAQNGILYDADEEGTATYMVQLSVSFIKKIEVKNKWLI